MSRRYNVLFLCTGNRARSILAEAILNYKGATNFVAYSAGSRPWGEVHPVGLRELKRAGVPTDGLRSKSWDEFAKPDAPKMDFVLTLCDDAAKETCPVWPGHPTTAHWGMTDPGNAGDDASVEAAFHESLEKLSGRIDKLLSLPFSDLDEAEMKKEIERIGRQ